MPERNETMEFIMKLKNIMSLNLKMAGHLTKASPGYLPVKMADAVAGVLGSLLQMLFFQKLIDFVIYTNPPLPEVAVGFFLFYLLCMAVKSFNYWVNNIFHEREKAKIERYYKRMVYSEVVKKGLKNYSSEQYRDMLYNAVYNDGSCLYAFAGNLCSLVSAVITLVSVGYLFGRLHIIFVAGAVLSAVKNCICSSRANKIHYRMHKENLGLDRCDTYIDDLFYEKRYIRELKLYPVGNYFIRKYKLLKELRWKNRKKHNIRKNMVKLVQKMMDVMLYVLNIIVLVYLLTSHKITVGEFSLVLSNFALLSAYVERIFMFFPDISNNANYIGDIVKILCSEDYHFPEIGCGGKGLVQGVAGAHVKCEGLRFSYDGENDALIDVSIELPLDKKIAIVGENGSGKSTFIKLLMGLYVPSGGRMEYVCPDMAGKESKELFSTMLQDYRIFAMSIRDNICPGAGSGEENLKEAVCFSGLWEKVEQLSDGMDTVLTGEFLEEGVSLSGGEQQKLAIARAYAKKNPVLVFDEPSANLDPIAENALIDKINQLAKGRGVILVTHNLAYTKHVDLVCVFEAGRIVEFGTPKELMERKGRYEGMLSAWLG